MGCFNNTCLLSGLPVCYRDDVAVLLLYENKIGNSNCYPTKYYNPVPAMFYGRYNDYGSVENCHGTQINFLLQEIIANINLQPDEAKKLTIEKFLQMETQGGTVHLSTRNSFYRSLRGDKDPHIGINHTVILQSVLNKLLDQYYYEVYVGSGEYRKVGYKDIVDSIDDYVHICKMFYSNNPFQIIPDDREVGKNLVGRYILSYTRGEGIGEFFGHHLQNTIQQLAVSGCVDDLRILLMEHAKVAIIHSYMNYGRKTYIVPQTGSQETSTFAQRLMSQITTEVGLEYDARFNE